MAAPLRRPLTAILLAALVGAAVAGCTPARVSPATPAPSTQPSASISAGDPTPVPAPASAEPTPYEGDTEPSPEQAGTTETDWGTILDSVPADFPVYPGAAAAEVDPGPVSGGWLAPAKVDAVAAWYRKELEQTGFTIENLSSPLEGGTRILDLTTDLPECRIQVIFGPADDTTMVTVLYGAGCSAGAG